MIESNMQDDSHHSEVSVEISQQCQLGNVLKVEVHRCYLNEEVPCNPDYFGGLYHSFRCEL